MFMLSSLIFGQISVGTFAWCPTALWSAQLSKIFDSLATRIRGDGRGWLAMLAMQGKTRDWRSRDQVTADGRGESAAYQLLRWSNNDQMMIKLIQGSGDSWRKRWMCSLSVAMNVKWRSGSWMCTLSPSRMLWGSEDDQMNITWISNDGHMNIN